MNNHKRRDDAAIRILRAGGNPDELDKILQDECRRKASKKLATTLLCTEFRFPTSLSAEQCTSDALAEFHASLINEGSRVVDLTCGLAIDAFHFATKADEVLCIDIDPIVADAVTHNSSVLKYKNVRVECADCRQWLNDNSDTKFDVAFIDPARRADDGSRLYSITQCRPDVAKLIPQIFRIAPRLIIKASPMLDISKSITELPGIKVVHSVGTKSECKELLFELERGYNGPVRVVADTIGGHSVDLAPGLLPESDYAVDVQVGDFVGEPWPAVMKCIPRGLLSGTQLHPDTFLWVNPRSSFPGNVYYVERVEAYSSSNMRRLAKEKLHASVAVRNLPITADQLRTKLKVQESSDIRLIATTIYPRQQVLLFLSRNIKKNE